MNVKVDMLVDFEGGYSITSVPMLDLCRHEELNMTVNLKTLIDQIYNQNSQYQGDFVIPWDQHSSSKEFKFTTVQNDVNNKLIFEVPFGMVKASFHNEDFNIKDCQKLDLTNDTFSMNKLFAS